MRALYMTVMLASVVGTAACDRAAADVDLYGRRPADSLALEPMVEVAEEPTPAPQPVVVRERTVVVREAAPEPQTQVVEKTHVKRDAAIGAALGATVGAIANDDNRVKGGIIGGVIGGAAGAIVGKTIDKEKKVVPR